MAIEARITLWTILVDKVIRALDGHERSVLSGSRVGVLGLTFKAGTDDLRDSPSISVIRDLIRFGAEISAYDPTVSDPLHPARAARWRASRCATIRMRRPPTPTSS